MQPLQPSCRALAMPKETHASFIKDCFAHLGIEAVGRRNPGASDFDHIKAALLTHELGFEQRFCEDRQAFLVLYDGEPTIEMRSARLSSIEQVSYTMFRAFGLQALEFLDGELQSF